MPKDSENIPFLDDLPSQPAEPSGFSHQQMVRCDECLRANPPTRVNCLYCGLALPLTEAAVALAKPALRPLEQWEQGYNNILLGLSDPDPGQELVNQVAAFLRQEATAIERVLSAKRALPVARAATHEEATLIEKRLRELGIETVIVPDQDLEIDTAPPRRLKKLEWREADVLAYQNLSTDGTAIGWAEISLVVAGRLFVKQVELRERRRRRTENEILDSSEITSDEAVVDIYTKGQRASWRIIASGFDFSCLGNSKALIAGENFPTLINLIRRQAANADFNDSYTTLRHCLEMVWPSGKRVESGGLRVRGSKYSTAEIITTSNEPQFTRYSRLCHYLSTHSLVQR